MKAISCSCACIKFTNAGLSIVTHSVPLQERWGGQRIITALPFLLSRGCDVVEKSTLDVQMKTVHSVELVGRKLKVILQQHTGTDGGEQSVGQQ